MKKIGAVLTALFAIFVVFGMTGKASVAELTQTEKEAYYQKYVSIVQETNDKYETYLEISSIEEFTVEDWKTPDEFKKIVTDMATQKWVAVPNDKNMVSPFATTSGSKTVTKYLAGVSVIITVNGSFNTILSEGRQVFSPTINSLTFSANKGTWAQLAYTANMIEGGRTFLIDIGGKFTYNGVSESKNIAVQFNCSSTGIVY
ncbi:hypothetical protein [Lysinibacillus piscis]|uniref:Lipoprotein n=1 Tax=Lysinibacillus piscis TaxID=2518931 RepID=A0ABQ5NJC5_9BACI|nr:hypothetical protein [Lysinibacillus sp. KH24]GLC88466.1 hypothetical protein LYSBPC_15930 [Lysinibacillus sp. KH24]